MRPPLPPTVVQELGSMNRRLGSVQRQSNLSTPASQLNAQIRFHRANRRLLEDPQYNWLNVGYFYRPEGTSGEPFWERVTIGIESHLYEATENFTLRELHLNGPWLESYGRSAAMEDFHLVPSHTLVQIVVAPPATSPLIVDTSYVLNDETNSRLLYPGLTTVFEALLPNPVNRQGMKVRLPSPILIRRGEVVSVWRYPRHIDVNGEIQSPRPDGAVEDSDTTRKWASYDFDWEHYALIGTSRAPLSVDVPGGIHRVRVIEESDI